MVDSTDDDIAENINDVTSSTSMQNTAMPSSGLNGTNGVGRKPEQVFLVNFYNLLTLKYHPLI